MRHKCWLAVALVGCTADPGGQTLVYELDCETTKTPIAEAALRDDVDIDAIAALGATRSASGIWEDGNLDTITVAATLATDAWQVTTFEGADCPDGVPEVYSGHVQVELTSASRRLDASWSNEVGAGIGSWALGTVLDETSAALVLSPLGRDPGGRVDVSFTWSTDGEILSGVVSTEDPDPTADVGVTIGTFGP